ncbi:MAG: hypothetical protein ACPL07_03655 [Candidatus Bathyarchaeia archaeon]
MENDNTIQFLEKEREVVNRLVCIYVSLLRKHLRELKDVSEVLCSAKGETECEKKFVHISLSIAMIGEIERWLC